MVIIISVSPYLRHCNIVLGIHFLLSIKLHNIINVSKDDGTRTSNKPDPVNIACPQVLEMVVILWTVYMEWSFDRLWETEKSLEFNATYSR